MGTSEAVPQELVNVCLWIPLSPTVTGNFMAPTLSVQREGKVRESMESSRTPHGDWWGMWLSHSHYPFIKRRMVKCFKLVKKKINQTKVLIIRKMGV